MPLKIDRHPKTRYFYASGTFGGNRIRQSLKTRDRRKAEELKAQMEARLWAAEVYGTEAVVVFEDAALSYLEDGHDPRFVEDLLNHFRGQSLRTITPKDIRDAARILYPDAAGATRNRQVITPARAIINHAAQQGWCQPIRVRQFKTAKPDRKAVSPDWVRAFMAAARERNNVHIAALSWFLYETGARISEAVSLEVGDMDMINCKANLGETKNGETYTASFSPELRMVLGKLPPRNGKVFGYANRHSIYGVWRTTCKAAKIPYVPPHQAGRHSLATALHSMGWSANDIAKAGRWKSVRLVQETYIHSDELGEVASSLIGKEMAKPVSTDSEKVLDYNKKRK